MSTLFDELKAGLEEALDHAAGRPIAGRQTTLAVERSEVQALRLKLVPRAGNGDSICVRG